MKRTKIDKQGCIKKIIKAAKVTDSIDFINFMKVMLNYVSIDLLNETLPATMIEKIRLMWNLLLEHNPESETCKILNIDGIYTSSYVLVVTKSKPFLVDSIRMALTRAGCIVNSCINIEDIKVCRDLEQKSISVTQSKSKDAISESCMLFNVNYLSPTNINMIEKNVLNILYDIKYAVEDWSAMKDKMQTSISEIETLSNDFSTNKIDEDTEFLKWLLEYFTFLGYREYYVEGNSDTLSLTLSPSSSLGVLRDDSSSLKSRYYADLTDEMRAKSLSQQAVLITKTNTLSTVHRPVYTDMIVCKIFDQQGNIKGERRFIGLFTSDAYDSDPSKIPVLREKVNFILNKAARHIGSYDKKRLLHILKRMPRDELFQAPNNELYDTSMGILDIQERRSAKLFVRKDICNRFVSCLVYVPRDNYSTELRIKMQKLLMESFQGREISFIPMFSESSLTAVHFVIRVEPETLAHEENTIDIDEIEKAIINMSRSWENDLEYYLIKQIGSDLGTLLYNKYARSIPAEFRSIYSGKETVKLLQKIHESDLNFELVEVKSNLILRVYQKGSFLSLSDAIPMLENIGMRVIGERLFEIMDDANQTIYISEFMVRYSYSNNILENINKKSFYQGIKAIWSGNVENDKFNSLILLANLSWQQVRVFRAYAKYLKQIEFSLGENYIQNAFCSCPEIVKLLLELFIIKFDPSITVNRKIKFSKVKRQINKLIKKTKGADLERAFLIYIEMIEATERVNFFKNNSVNSCIAFKIRSSKIAILPLPKPMFEIFVFSERVEGIHLRAGKVARGGIRWSDRKEDFRTEVLGLMKAQNGKNSLIVPAGAKGGFVVKRALDGFDSKKRYDEAVFCYKQFISGLLDLTDNIIDSSIVKPDKVVCHDEDDAYMVVAADKGTASFSDIANSISADYNFWLGDAFASGGSYGYDHKKMGITAKGAWVSVEWHFKTLNKSMNQPFTVVGIGGMVGDVFGNGMLLSNQIKLIAAFDHQYIFIDPNPDPKISYAERQRMFKTPGVTWNEYDRGKMSPGSGIYSRSEKLIEISDAAKAALSVNTNKFKPDELIKAILLARVDLLWNGGIGTYVKSKNETNAMVGDHANDNVRVNGSSLRCKVIGEGGNLGLTQLGRIEYASSGGQINTDSIDNSAGVDCSDHEVNIKILFNLIKTDPAKRNELLIKMTDEVSQMVLLHNLDQNKALSLETMSLPGHTNLYNQFIEYVSRIGLLNPNVEFLPSKQETYERLNYGNSFLRPELSILLSYSKIALQNDLLKTNIVDLNEYEEFFNLSFPACMMHLEKSDNLWTHSLRREIIATHLSNSFIHELGITFIPELLQESSVGIDSVVKAYAFVRKMFGIKNILQEINKHNDSISAKDTLFIHNEIRRFLRLAVKWMLRNFSNAGCFNMSSADHETFINNTQKITKIMPDHLIGFIDKEHKEFLSNLLTINLSDKLVKELSFIKLGLPALNIAKAVDKSTIDLSLFVQTYFIVSNRAMLHNLRFNLSRLKAENKWDLIASYSLRAQLETSQRNLVSYVYKSIHTDLTKNHSASSVIELWLSKNKQKFERFDQLALGLSKRNQSCFTALFAMINELNALLNVFGA